MDTCTAIVCGSGYLLFLVILGMMHAEHTKRSIQRSEEKQAPKKEYDLRNLFVDQEGRNGKNLLAVATDALDLGQESLLAFVISKMSIGEKLEFLEYTFVNKRNMGASIVLNSLEEYELHEALILLYKKNLVGTRGFVASELNLCCNVCAKFERMEVIGYAARNELSIKNLSKFSSSSIFNSMIDAALLVSDYLGHKSQLDSIVLHVSRGYYVYRENKALLILLPLVIVDPITVNPMLTWKAASDNLEESFRLLKSVI